MDILVDVLIMFAIIGVFVFLYYYPKARRIKRIAEEQERQKKLYDSQDEIKKQLCNMIASDFEKLGWSDWDESIHAQNDQFVRLGRAVNGEEHLTLLQYSSRHEKAIVRGKSGCYIVSGHRCSCPDFRERNLPCKHMYALATMLPDYEEHLSPITLDNPSSQIEDCILLGLKFGLVGRGQDEVKRYINSHSGTWGNDYWRETSAIILASDIHTQRVEDAIEHNVEIMTFDDLKDFVDACSETAKKINPPPCGDGNI